MDFDPAKEPTNTLGVGKTNDNRAEATWYPNRQFERYDVHLDARLTSAACEFSVRVRNLSGGGACLDVTSFIIAQVPENAFALTIDGFGHLPCRTSWKSANQCGVEFLVNHTKKSELDAQLAKKLANPN
ncbi:PilZ domain-containing protein [Roseovarius sp. W115]|uniref:PilZ domain-containing protein n=1 Tax=Roseovarius rhodophyticola TaxID=3080827 RepID=UPI002937105A|nr:PilZ domain-containing protein [Roseovarius sp. W115]